MTDKIGRLIRTNVALAALCIIAIGALVSMFRSHEVARQSDASAGASGASPVISGQPLGGAPAAAKEDPLAHSPFRSMPAPSTFSSFAYKPGGKVAVSGTCADAYRVIMIFSADVDYRADPLSAVYNDAASCSAGHPFVEYLDLSGYAAIDQAGAGARYYIVRASEGKRGSWYAPY